MKHLTSPSFWKCYERLPSSIRKIADKNFTLLKKNAKHPSLYFKKIGKYRSVRIGTRHRALAVENDKDLLWFWIGSHADYDKLVK